MLEDLCKEVLEDLCKEVLEEKQSTPTVVSEEISNVIDTELGDNFGKEDMCQGELEETHAGGRRSPF